MLSALLSREHTPKVAYKKQPVFLRKQVMVGSKHELLSNITLQGLLHFAST